MVGELLRVLCRLEERPEGEENDGMFAEHQTKVLQQCEAIASAAHDMVHSYIETYLHRLWAQEIGCLSFIHTTITDLPVETSVLLLLLQWYRASHILRPFSIFTLPFPVISKGYYIHVIPSCIAWKLLMHMWYINIYTKCIN